MIDLTPQQIEKVLLAPIRINQLTLRNCLVMRPITVQAPPAAVAVSTPSGFRFCAHLCLRMWAVLSRAVRRRRPAIGLRPLNLLSLLCFKHTPS
jgi:hypothetical protein